MTYGNGKWVAAGGVGLRMYSTDAVTWNTILNYYQANAFRGIAFGGGIFLATGDNGTESHSTDGINWTTTTASASHNGVIFAGSRFYAVDSSTSMIVQSAVADGTNSNWTTSWSAVPNLPTATFSGITYNGGHFYASSSTALYVSNNGTAWTSFAGAPNTPIIAQGGKYLTFDWLSLRQSSNLTSWISLTGTLNPGFATDSIQNFDVSP